MNQRQKATCLKCQKPQREWVMLTPGSVFIIMILLVPLMWLSNHKYIQFFESYTFNFIIGYSGVIGIVLGILYLPKLSFLKKRYTYLYCYRCGNRVLPKGITEEIFKHDRKIVFWSYFGAIFVASAIITVVDKIIFEIYD